MYVLPKCSGKTTISQLYSREDCGYCRSVGKPSGGHAKTSCPELFALKPCTLCGADGYENHTLMHCPSQQKIKLELKEDHRRRMDARHIKETYSIAH
ncbi:nanos RNA binding domain protein [Ostertagia ostertagi]